MDCLEVYEMIGGWREAEEVLRKYVRREAEKVRTLAIARWRMLLNIDTRMSLF